MGATEHEACIGLSAGTAVVLATAAPTTLVERGVVRTREGQPYHEAQGMPIDRAEPLIARRFDESCERATEDLRAILAAAKARGFTVRRAAVVWREYRLPSSIESILRSHPLCHAAEGQMTREAIAAGCERCGLDVSLVLESDLDTGTAGLDLVAIGRAAGPPWRKDHKQAATAAFLASRR